MLSKNILKNKHYRDGVEITAEEYEAEKAEIKAKADMVDALYTNRITVDDIREDWRDEIARRVNERIAAESEEEDAGATDEDYLAALAEMGVQA